MLGLNMAVNSTIRAFAPTLGDPSSPSPPSPNEEGLFPPILHLLPLKSFLFLFLTTSTSPQVE